MSEVITTTAAAAVNSAAAVPKNRKPTASKPTVKAGAPGDTLPAIANPTESRGMTEAKAYLLELERVASVGGSLGNEALNALFQLLGKSADKNGRPQVIPTCGAQLAMIAREQLTFNQRVQLANTANKNVATWAKPVFSVKSKAGAGDGSASYKLNMPLQLTVDIA